MDELFDFDNNSGSSSTFSIDPNFGFTPIDLYPTTTFNDPSTFGGGVYTPDINIETSYSITDNLSLFSEPSDLLTIEPILPPWDDFSFISNTPSLEFTPPTQSEIVQKFLINEATLSFETITTPFDIDIITGVNQPPIVETDIFNNNPVTNFTPLLPTPNTAPNPIPDPLSSNSSLIANSEIENPISDKERGGNLFYC